MELALDTFDLDPDEVRRRFQSAREKGLPHWPWPDVAVDRWHVALRAIGATIATVLGSGPAGTPFDEDPDSLSIACYTSGTGPLLGFWAEKGLISAAPRVAPLLALHLAHNRLRMARMTRIAGDVVSALEAVGVEVTVLKGMHTAYAYFPEPGARPLSDIDLLISSRDEAAAGKALSAIGFERGKPSRWPPQVNWRLRDVAPEPRTLCLVHADDPWSVDLQTSLSSRTAGGGRVARFEEVRHEFSRARWACSPKGAVLDQPLQLLQLASHASCDLRSLTLLRMVELITVIRRDEASGSLVWGEFLELGQRTGALAFVYPALQCCEKISPGTIPVEALERCRRAAPETVRRIFERVEPALTHCVERCSFGERYMWADTWALKARQFGFELIPPTVTSLTDVWEIYGTRFRRLKRGTVTW